MAQSCRAVSSQPRWASPVTWKIEALPRKTPETANDHAFSQLFCGWRRLDPAHR